MSTFWWLMRAHASIGGSTLAQKLSGFIWNKPDLRHTGFLVIAVPFWNWVPFHSLQRIFTFNPSTSRTVCIIILVLQMTIELPWSHASMSAVWKSSAETCWKSRAAGEMVVHLDSWDTVAIEASKMAHTVLKRSCCQNSNEDNLPLNSRDSWALCQNKSPSFRSTYLIRRKEILRNNGLK